MRKYVHAGFRRKEECVLTATRRLRLWHLIFLLAAGPLLVFVSRPVMAFNLYDGSQSGNNLEVNLTTELEYSVFYRVNDPSAVLAGPNNANGSEGDLDFRHGFFANEVEALPVLDLRDGDYGMHVSGEFYLNTPYLQTNQNNQPSTLNPFSVAKNTDFTSATRNVNGENARLLDAFAFATHHFDDGQTFSLKAGRQTLFWGQSLFFTNNGLAAGQAPIDIITAQSLPNPQSQQVFLPVGQAVATYSPINNLTLQGYYQFEWQHDVFQGVGGYFNSSDLLDKGGQRLILAPGAYLFRAKDLTPPSQNGQFGVSVQYALGNYDLGLYALRYDSKAPELYAALGAPTPTSNGLSLGTYRLVYPRDISIYGTSVSTNIGAANVAAEISGRKNMPLVSGLGFSTAANPGNANSDPLYAVGSTLHAQASAIYLSPGLPLVPGGVTVDGEVEFNHVLEVTENKAALAPGRQASAAAFEVVLTPAYYNVLTNLNVTFPIGISYNVLGRSQIDSSMQHGTGTFSFGVTGTYNAVWIAGLTYVDYFGKPDPTYNADADRGYVSFNIERTF